MIDVILVDKSPNDILKIVYELRSVGCVQGVDFDFEYHKPVFNDWSGDVLYNQHTIFKFYKESLATWFVLKYQ
jgi:hypothetical protein